MVKLLLLCLAGCSLTGLKNQCETQSDCLAGFTCTSGTCATTTCTPITCDGHCGELDDHCNGTLECGACPDHCANNTKDSSETDVDCGGDCAPCAQGLHCAQASDCQAGTCDLDTCRAGTWSTVAAMPTAREDLVAIAASGKIYAIGGQSAAGVSAVVEVYDPNANSWTTKAAMPTPRYGMAAVLGTDGRIYVIGGNYTDVSHAGPSLVVEAYDPVANTWATLPSLPTGRYHAAAAADSTGLIYAIGGFDGTTFTTYASVATWKVGDASWSTLPDVMTTARNQHAAVAMPDGIYAIGGATNAGAELAAAEVYSSGWNTIAPMPTSRKALAAAPLGNDIYAIAGSRYVSSNMAYSRVVETYDTVGHTWSQVTSIPSGRFSHAAVALGGKIYVLGGHREDTGAKTAIVDVYTP